MKKIAAKIKTARQRARCLLAADGLLALAGLLGTPPAFRLILVRAERIYRCK